jgi:acylphosphatase
VTPEAVQRVRWVVSGRVQGVGFRWYVFQAAGPLPVRGWVSNLPDGRVEVVAEGPGSALQTLEEALRSGPRHARVESVEKSQYLPETTLPNTFEVR